MLGDLERRKFQRLEFPANVAVEIVSVREAPKGLPRMQIKSRNISKERICLETAGIGMDGINLLSGPPFAREHRLHLGIELFPEEPPLMATGEVRWYDITRDAPESICLLGVEFVEIQEGGKDRIVRFLKNV